MESGSNISSSAAFGYIKIVSVTITAGNVSGLVAHSLGLTPKTGRPNPDGINGVNTIASADATNVTVTIDAPQLTDIIFTIPLFR